MKTHIEYGAAANGKEWLFATTIDVPFALRIGDVFLFDEWLTITMSSVIWNVTESQFEVGAEEIYASEYEVRDMCDAMIKLGFKVYIPGNKCDAQN